jgi:NAD(P)-dependent dehydrogenase (short-subunit alcohol dehydrogenase family)
MPLGYRLRSLLGRLNKEAEVELTGKVALVTGASRGIGEYIAYELASNGVNVVVMAKSTLDAPHRVFQGTVEQTAALVREYGVEALAIRGDVSREEDVDNVRQAVVERFGRCDILVNNAAMSYVTPFLELTIKRWDVIMAVNLRGPTLLSKAFLPAMMDRGEGQIINISSGDGRLDIEETLAAALAVGAAGTDASFGETGQDLLSSTTAYGTSKAALNRFTVGLAHEMRDRGVAINALEVSAVTEPYRMNLPHADLSRNELPEAPAQLVVWLASQPADFTGHVLSQPELLARLRSEGIVRPKVDPT